MPGWGEAAYSGLQNLAQYAPSVGAMGGMATKALPLAATGLGAGAGFLMGGPAGAYYGSNLGGALGSMGQSYLNGNPNPWAAAAPTVGSMAGNALGGPWGGVIGSGLGGAYNGYYNPQQGQNPWHSAMRGGLASAGGSAAGMAGKGLLGA